MAEFEEKLNAILGNQDAMGQIMALARSLSGGPADGQSAEGTEEPEDYAPVSPQPLSQSGPDLSQILGNLDPNMIQTGLEIMRQVQEGGDRNTALIQALRPFLREERQARLDRALQIAQMTRLIRVAIGALGGREGQRDV